MTEDLKSDIKVNRKTQKLNGQITFPGRTKNKYMKQRLEAWLRSLGVNPQRQTRFDRAIRGGYY